MKLLPENKGIGKYVLTPFIAATTFLMSAVTPVVSLAADYSQHIRDMMKTKPIELRLSKVPTIFSLESGLDIPDPQISLLEHDLKKEAKLVINNSNDNTYQPNFFNIINEKGYSEKTHDFIHGIQLDTSTKTPSLLDLKPPSTVGDTTQAAAGLIASFLIHEYGHQVIANYVGAEGYSINFLKKEDGQFFLGIAHVDSMDKKSRLPYFMGGEVFADLTFEHALAAYRKDPNMFNQSLLFFSGTDFLRYSIYSFYLSEGHKGFDPIVIQKETGLSREAILAIGLAKTALNAYRAYSGKDDVIPYFNVSKDSASLNLLIPF